MLTAPVKSDAYRLSAEASIIAGLSARVEDTAAMKKNFAVTALALLLAVHIGSGWTQGVDRQLFKIESSLCEDVDTRVCTEQMLEAQRKVKSRSTAAHRG